MNKMTLANLLQRALDYASNHYGEEACRNGLCMAVSQMRARGYLTKEECHVLHDVIEDLVDEWGQRCMCRGKDFAYLWVGIAIYHSIDHSKARTAQLFPLWRQAYEDKIKELKTGTHHG